MLGIHRNYLDFEILQTDNLKTLVFLDCSSYINPPEKPLIEVYLPGFDRYLLAGIVANQVNTLNSNTLGLNDSLSIGPLQDLPDGIWTIRYKICPYEYNFVDKTIMRTTYLTQKLKMLYNEIALDSCDCPTEADKYVQNTLNRINLLIRGSELAASHDIKKAQRCYHTSNELIDELSKKFCQNCRF